MNKLETKNNNYCDTWYLTKIQRTFYCLYEFPTASCYLLHIFVPLHPGQWLIQKIPKGVPNLWFLQTVHVVQDYYIFQLLHKGGGGVFISHCLGLPFTLSMLLDILSGRLPALFCKREHSPHSKITNNWSFIRHGYMGMSPLRKVS